jgi:hypothetical protein
MSLRLDIRQVYSLLGNVTPDNLPIEVALPIYYSLVKKYLNKLKISVNNYFLKSSEIPAGVQDFPINIPDFGAISQLQVYTGSSIDPYKPVQKVAFEVLLDHARSGAFAYAVYGGVGTSARIRFTPAQTYPARVRVYYEPAVLSGFDYGADNPIPESLVDVINYEAAVLCAPHLRDLPPERMQALAALIPLYQRQADELRTIFETLSEGHFEHRPYKRLPFRRSNFGRLS